MRDALEKDLPGRLAKRVSVARIPDDLSSNTKVSGGTKARSFFTERKRNKLLMDPSVFDSPIHENYLAEDQGTAEFADTKYEKFGHATNIESI